MKNSMKNRFVGNRLALGAALSLVTTAALTACAVESGDTSSGGATAVCIDAVTSQALDDALAVPSFDAPGPAFDSSAAAGMTVFNIPLSSSNQFDNAITAASKDAAQKAGLEFVNWPNQGKPSEWVEGVEAAISQHADAIILEGGPDPELLGPQLAEAKAAGIQVVSAHLYDASEVDQAMTTSSSLAGVVPAHHHQAGELMADYVARASGCNADVLFVTADDVSASQGIEDAFTKTLSSTCPDCETTVVNVPIGSWAQSIPTQVQSSLTKDPKVNWVVPVYAAGAAYVASGVRQSNASQRVKSASYGGTASVNQMIEDGQILVGQVAESPEWNGWANVDQVLRLLTGNPAVPDENVPRRIIDTTNVKDTGTPSQEGAGFGDASTWEDGYSMLWGI
jgi:ribose transport system substrate-binding protein